jgi:O-antigen/teichoic acid export membrane protein
MHLMGATAADPRPPPADVLDTPEAGARAIRGSAVHTLGYVAGSLLALISAPLLVRHLGVVDFGRYYTVISLVALVGGVTDIGLATVAVREYASRTGVDREAFMRQILGLRLVLSLAGVLVATGFAALAGYGGELVLGTAVAGLGLVLTVVAHTFGVPLSVRLRMGWLTGIDIAGKVLTLVFVVVLILASSGVVGFLAIAVPASLMTLVLTVAVTRRDVSLRPSLHTAELRRLLRDTLPLAVATVLNTLYARVVIIVMSLIATGLATGYFGTAARVVEVAIGVPLVLIGTTFPIFARAARDDAARLRYVVQRVAEIALIGGVWMTLAMVVGAGVITDVLVGGTQAAPVADVLRVMAFALVPVTLNITWQTALVALRCHRELLVVNGLALAAIVALTFALVPALGADGAALAVVGGEMLLATMSAIALLRARRGLRPEVRLVSRVVLASAVGLAAAVVPPIPEAAQMVVVTLVYFSALGLLRAIPSELRDAFVQRMRGGSPPA